MMQNEKPFYYRIIAIFCAFLLCIGLAVSCFVFVPGKVHATSQDAQIVYDTATNLALEAFTDPGLAAEEIAVISAQAGLAYWYAAVTDASTWVNGNSRVFSGYTWENGTLYFGSACINDDASTIYANISDSNNNHISISYTLNNRQYLQYTRLYPGSSVGFSTSGGYSYTLSTTSGSAATFNYDALISGDSFDGWVCVGSSPNTLSAVFRRPNPSNCGILFYGGGLNLSGTEFPTTGDFSTDFADLKTTLQEDYPDVDPEYFLPDPAVDIPTDTTDCSGCNCYHEIIVNVEPTIIVEPTINVYVTENINIDNNFEVPSDWVEDYTAPTQETIPPFSNPSETMPSMDMEDIDSNYGNGVRFWFWLAKTFIDDSDLGLIVKFSFIMVVSGFIIWRLGGGKKGD